MPSGGSYRLDHVWKVRIVRAGVPWSRIVEYPIYELETSAGPFELRVVALSPKSKKKKVKKRYRLRRRIAGKTSVKGEGWYGVTINVKTGKVLMRGVVPEWLKARVATLSGR